MRHPATLADILEAARVAEKAVPDSPVEDAMDKFIRKFTHAIAQTPASFARQSDLHAALDTSYKGSGRVLRRSPRQSSNTTTNTDDPIGAPAYWESHEALLLD